MCSGIRRGTGYESPFRTVDGSSNVWKDWWHLGFGVIGAVLGMLPGNVILDILRSRAKPISTGQFLKQYSYLAGATLRWKPWSIERTERRRLKRRTLNRISNALAGLFTGFGMIGSVLSHANDECIVIGSPPICGAQADTMIWILGPIGSIASLAFLYFAFRKAS